MQDDDENPTEPGFEKTQPGKRPSDTKQDRKDPLKGAIANAKDASAGAARKAKNTTEQAVDEAKQRSRNADDTAQRKNPKNTGNN